MGAAGAMMALQFAGSVVGGIEERSALRKSARIDLENARLSELQGELDAYQTAREARLAQGAGLAMAAADGNVVGTGTIGDLVEQAALERELEIGALRNRARGEAANLRASAKAKKRAGNMALFKGLVGGAAAFAGGKADQANTDRLSEARASDRASKTQGPLARGADLTQAPSRSTGQFKPSLLPDNSPLALRRRVPWGATRLPGY